MRVAWVTDIHLEFLDHRGVKRFLRNLCQQEADALLVGGDTGQAASVTHYLELIAAAVQVPIYFVLGNHDYYGGSIGRTRDAVREMTRESQRLCWLDNAGVIGLTSETALIGHGGWGDARLGNFLSSPVQLNDWRQIEELTGLSQTRLIDELQQLGEEAACHFRAVLPEALANYPNVVVLTHVPPWAETAWHEGAHSSADWTPWFACGAVGEVLEQAMAAAPDQQMTVLCGHTHGEGITQILPNLTVHTAPAVYGKPAIAQIFRCE
jgi:predicted MPP superfamily phosphohydrolase